MYRNDLFLIFLSVKIANVHGFRAQALNVFRDVMELVHIIVRIQNFIKIQTHTA